MAQYFSDILQKPTSGLEIPNLQAVAKDYDVSSTLIMCRLTIAIGVQCERNKDFIDKIQGLSETDQHHLMKAIEQVLGNTQFAHLSADFYSRLWLAFRLCPQDKM